MPLLELPWPFKRHTQKTYLELLFLSPRGLTIPVASDYLWNVNTTKGNGMTQRSSTLKRLGDTNMTRYEIHANHNGYLTLWRITEENRFFVRHIGYGKSKARATSDLLGAE